MKKLLLLILTMNTYSMYIKMEVDQRDKYVFVGCRNITCVDSFGDENSGNDILVKETNDL